MDQLLKRSVGAVANTRRSVVICDSPGYTHHVEEEEGYESASTSRR